MRSIDGKRISLIIFSIISLFFLLSGIISADNYANVLLYRNKVMGENPLAVHKNIDKMNGTIVLDILFKNPSPYTINFYSLTAIFYVENKTVATFQRDYYFYEEFPFSIGPNSLKNITYYVKAYNQYQNLLQNSTILNITIQIKVRFSGFLYYYENPGENYSPERYYLTEMVMMEIDWSGKA